MSPARADHAEYVKGVLAGLACDHSNVECAVEPEARNDKQIRGAILDLAWHPAAKKLLMIVKAKPMRDDDRDAIEGGFSALEAAIGGAG